MTAYLTIAIPGLDQWATEIVMTTNYRDMMTTAHFLRAGVARLYVDDNAALDVLFAELYKEAPELRDWPYEDEDDLLLANNLIACANYLYRVMVPMLPPDSVAHYFTHDSDTITVYID